MGLMMAFTDKQLQSLKRSAKRYEVLEEGRTGLRIRVSPSGAKTFVFVYRYDGRLRRLTLHAYEENTHALARAREAVVAARAQMRDGIDPATAKQAAATVVTAAPTVGLLADTYIERHAKPRKRSWEEDKRLLDKDVLPLWKSRPAASITRAEVNTLLDTIVDRGSPVAANRTLAVVRKMFNFGVQRGLVAANPCLGVVPPGKERSRERVLSEAEIKQLWGALDQTPMTLQVRTILRLALVTAQRKGEVSRAEWSEFDLDTGWWTIPPKKAKNGLAHRVPLSPLALTFLKAMPRVEGSPYVFPSRLEGRSVNDDSVDNAMREHAKVLGVTDVTPHDLRRTAASHMASMGIPRLVLSKILNHADGSVTAVYDRHSYDDEKRQALLTWAAKLGALLGLAPVDAEEAVSPDQDVVIDTDAAAVRSSMGVSPPT
ncbi:MAG: tyrosine-type recombinase/integrase [Gammaproteobacteria bacterium]